MTRNGSVAQDIQKWILSGRFVPGQRLPSERKLSTDLGVSRATVQEALKELQRTGVILREPNHRPIVSSSAFEAQNRPRSGKDMVAVWIFPDLQDLGGSAMLHGIRTVLGANNYRLVIGGTPTADLPSLQQAEGEFLRSLADNRDIAGAIVWETGSADFEEVHADLLLAKIPVVFIDREPKLQCGADVVAANHRRGAYTAVRHLIELGHERIAMVTNRETVSSTLDRVDGYRQALQDAELPSQIEFMPWIGPKAALRESAEQILRALLTRADPPTAIFAVNDQIAFFLLEAAKALDIHIPEELSLVGFDWLMRWLPSGGDLTSVAQPFEEIGQVAANRLLELARSDQPQVPQQILLEASLVVKNTTAPPISHFLRQRSLSSTGESNETTLVGLYTD